VVRSALFNRCDATKNGMLNRPTIIDDDLRKPEPAFDNENGTRKSSGSAVRRITI
jgi:hypothetical protein